MTLPAGTRLGAYEIVALAGAGGMGEVYRARDSRLRRDVAIKILPAGLAADADRLRRFELEAEAVGRLSHPNVLVVHDVGTSGGSPYLVTEFLEGETLRDQLAAGALSESRAIDVALQIARGLRAAHAKGIVHRDLKPENVFLTAQGHVKILDFGLAKLTAPALEGASAATASVHQTGIGVVLGTVGYMSPEQVRGEEADQRSDIFALGAVLYEARTGQRAFPGSSQMEVLSAILHSDTAGLSDDGSELSPGLASVIRHCLEKDRSDRFQSMVDLCFALERLTAGSVSARHQGTPPTPGRSRWSPIAGWLVAGGLACVALALATTGGDEAPPAATTHVASISPPGESPIRSFTVSPDGRRLALTAAVDGVEQLWIRTLDDAVVRTWAVQGTAGAENPFWSPDSRSLGFFADNQLKVVDVDSGGPRPLCPVTDNRGGSWGADDFIVFAPHFSGPLHRIRSTGGPPAQLTNVDATRQETTHRWPHFLPDGRHFLYFVRSNEAAHTGMYLGSLSGQTAAYLGPSSSDAQYADPGYLLFVRDRALIAHRFDARTLTLSGEPIAVIPQVGHSIQLNRAHVSASNTGVLVYGASEDKRPIWFDRNGDRLDTAGTAEGFGQIGLSPDERRLALELPDARTGANDVFLVELDRGTIATRFTTDPGSDSRPIWLGNDAIAWASNRAGTYHLYRKSARAGAREELLLETSDSKTPSDGSPDGRFLLYASVDSKSTTSLKVLPLTGERTPFALLDSGFNEAQGRFSPDGRWIAYTTDKDGTFEVYVVEAGAVLPAIGQSVTARRGASFGVRVSPYGGTQPIWRRGGGATELYYLAPDKRLMAVSIDASGRPSIPQALFRTRITDTGPAYQTFAASADGQRFLVLTPADTDPAATVVFNWTPLLNRTAK